MSEEKWQWIEGGVAAPQGFWANGVQAGVKYQNKYDVAVLMSETPAQAAGVFTLNKVKAHPVLLCQKRIAAGEAQAIVINSGNANACVGEAGDRDALAMTQKAADSLGVNPEKTLIASTGVIGVEMPIETILKGIEKAAEELALLKAGSSDDQSLTQKCTEAAHKAALAIMTTDTVIKESALELECQGGKIRLGAMAKGSGMIHPNMGTMLGFMTTDAAVSADKLQKLLREAVDASFNMVTVDGDTSTNDSVFFLANGASGITPSGEEWEKFADMVKAMCEHMAKTIARDGEGASKFIEVQVNGALSQEDARKVAKSICGSSLVKTAIFGEDPNWGRILTALGYAGADVDPDQVDVYLGNVQVAQAGKHKAFDEAEAKQILHQQDIVITVNLNLGLENATAWGCDLTYKYVEINGSYTT